MFLSQSMSLLFGRVLLPLNFSLNLVLNQTSYLKWSLPFESQTQAPYYTILSFIDHFLHPTLHHSTLCWLSILFNLPGNFYPNSSSLLNFFSWFIIPSFSPLFLSGDAPVPSEAISSWPDFLFSDSFLLPTYLLALQFPHSPSLRSLCLWQQSRLQNLLSIFAMHEDDVSRQKSFKDLVGWM